MSNDKIFMKIALDSAKTAYENNEIPVGAVLINDEKIVASAHNSKEATHDPTAHAELMVIREGAIKLGDWRLSRSILYVTKEPCIMCAGAIVNARIEKLVYGCRDDRYGAVDSNYQIVYDPRLNHKVSVRSGVLEDECAEILKRFFKMRR